MQKIFLRILSAFSLIFMFVFSVNAKMNMSIDKVISFIRSSKKIENIIPIAMATDNNYAYPTIVAMTSILENRKPKTHIDFYVMLSGDFDHSLKNKIDSLRKKYGKCTINFIDMKNKLENLYISGYIKTATYYRLLLPDLLPNLDKILYMDVDTITQKDLSDLFNVNINDYYLAGCKDVGVEWISNNCTDYIKRFGKRDCIENYINAGIILFNLKKMREEGLVDKLIECASSHNLTCHDQDALNWVCHDKIKKIKNIYNNFPYYISNLQDQVIIHYACEKPWNNKDMKYADIWWDYAKKTGFIKEIQNKFLDESKKKKIRHEEMKNVIGMIKGMIKAA